jgi:peptidoglycan/LPS O-acetylase OafA/YrhL
MLFGEMPAPPVFQPPPGNPRFPLIDSLRGIAALSIFGLHAVLVSNADDTWYGRFAVSLDVGVTIFFVISGFLLYRPFLSAHLDSTPAPSLAAYSRNRALRILPAYWVAMVVLALAIGLPGFWTDHTWAYFAFLQEASRDWSRGGILPTWSLTVEASFYVMLPLLVLAAHRLAPPRRREARLRRELLVLAGLFAAGILYRVILRAEIGDDPTSNLWALLPATIDWFVLGMLLAVASVAWHGRSPGAVRVVERHPLVPWAVAGALFLVVALGVRSPGDFPTPTGAGDWLALHLLYGAIAVAIVLPAVFGDGASGLPRRVMRHRLAAWLGLVSYGLFLWHQPIALELSQADPGSFWRDHLLLCVTVFGLAISLACAAASYYLVERPFLRLKRTRSEPPPVAARPAEPAPATGLSAGGPMVRSPQR